MRKGFEQRLKEDWKEVEKTLSSLEEAQNITYDDLQLEINHREHLYTTNII
ncbi:MAG: hypothetical protein NTW17_02515 [Candidatus Pacearchaeota archaeon]|nr:hypothetical protein [Candidatus Pacearchaeota archaeon]